MDGQQHAGARGHGSLDRAHIAVVVAVRDIDKHGHQSRLLVTFEGVEDRTAAEALRGLSLAVRVDPAETPEDPEEFYDHQLVGLAVSTTDGDPVGEVADVVHGTGQDLLAVRTPDGREVLVPFVTALVPVVDVTGGRVEVADRPGLLSPLPEGEA